MAAIMHRIISRAACAKHKRRLLGKRLFEFPSAAGKPAGSDQSE
jgi:hypothetical protein